MDRMSNQPTNLVHSTWCSRCCRRPPDYSHNLITSILGIIPVLVVGHCANAIWIYSREDIFESKASTWPLEFLDSFWSQVNARAFRGNTFPMMLVMVVGLSLTVIHKVLSGFARVIVNHTPLGRLTGIYFETQHVGSKEHNPAFTESFIRWFRKQDGCTEGKPPKVPAGCNWNSELQDGYFRMTKSITGTTVAKWGRSGAFVSPSPHLPDYAPLQTSDVIRSSTHQAPPHTNLTQKASGDTELLLTPIGLQR